MSYVPAEPPYGDFRPPQDRPLQATEPSVSTYEEWRVTGQPDDGCGPIDHIRSAREGDDDPEAAVRKLARAFTWTDGPHLHKRTVTVTDWTEVDT